MLVDNDCPKVVGVKQTLKKMDQETCKFVCIAKDAELKVIEPIIQKAESLRIQVVYINSMIELGKLCDIDVGAAAALFLNK
jgi:large subunit ribosomal protein L7A